MRFLKTLALLLFSFCFAQTATAVRRGSSGFETNDLTATEWNSATNATIQTGTVHSGTYALQCNITATTCVATRTITTDTAGTYWGRTYVRWTGFPDVNLVPVILDANASGTFVLEVLFLNATSTLQLRNNLTATTTNGASVLSTGTWYRIEFKHVLLDAGGSMEMKLFLGDSTSVLETLSITGEDTLNTDIGQLQVGPTSVSNTSNVFYDDVAVNDETGTFQIDYAGPEKFAMLKPASNNSVAWTKTGANCSGTTQTDCVDDEPGLPDDASGFNATGSPVIDRLNSTTLPAEVTSDADILIVDVYARFGTSATNTNTARTKIWDETGTLTNGTTISTCRVIGWTFMGTGTHQVFDPGTRTKANIDLFDWGYELVSAINECRITSLWVNIGWIEASTAAAMRQRAVVIE